MVKVYIKVGISNAWAKLRRVDEGKGREQIEIFTEFFCQPSNHTFGPIQPAFWIYSIQHHSTDRAGTFFQKHCMLYYKLLKWRSLTFLIADPQIFNFKNKIECQYFDFSENVCAPLSKKNTHIDSVLCPQVRVKWIYKASEVYLWSDYLYS